MKILLVSNRNPYFHNTNYYREAAIRALGHEVIFFDVNAYLIPGRLRDIFPLLGRMDVARINDALTQACGGQKIDLCLVVGGHTVLARTVSFMRKQGVAVVLWTTDAPHPKYFPNIEAAALECTRVFCAGTEALELLRAGGVKDPQWLPFACDPHCHAPQELLPADKARDAVFVGSYYPNREKMLEILSGLDIGIWGPGWRALRDDSPLKGKVANASLDYPEWTRIFTAAKIVLVVHYQDGKIPCYQASPKLFEAMACGAFVLCDDQRDARALFKDGEHLVFFRTPSELKDKVEYYLAHPGDRERISLAGRREVLARHTYEQRMSRILTAGKGV